MGDIFEDAFGAVSGDLFDEIPVKVEVFVTDILHHPPLSDIQADIVRASTQIFDEETLYNLYGPDEGARIWKWTKTEVICALGKGSGKDQMAKISCLYVVYQLLCMKDPQQYFNKPDGDYIDIMNIAINADQASRVFFGPLTDMLRKCEWFDGKYDAKMKEVMFDKYIRLTSGHSESESLEGYNVILVVLDEISGFAEVSTTGNQKAKTASAIYKMHRASVNSRFPKRGKLLLLSFPRYHDDFISKRYNSSIAEKDIVYKEYTYKRDPDLPDGHIGNEFKIEWEEDHILRFTSPRIWAIKRTSWDVNPTKDIEDYVDDFDADMGDALTRFAAMPTVSTEDAFFKNHEKIESAFSITNGVDNDGAFWNQFIPRAGTKYFMHVDLAQKHDRCVVAMAHVDQWKKVSIGSGIYEEIHPIVVVDAIRWWQPSKAQSVEFKWVIDYILAVRRRGFDVQLVTFDRWNAHDTRNFLEDNGMKTDNLSVGTQHYADFKVIMYDERLLGPAIPEIHEELKELMFVKNKVDHPRKGYKDLSDAACGAIFNAVANTQKPRNKIVEAKTYKDIKKELRTEQRENARREGVIYAPKRNMPDHLKNSLFGIR